MWRANLLDSALSVRLDEPGDPQPRDPFGAMPVHGALNYSDPYRGAAYLPRDLMGRHNALFPSFGHIPRA